MIYFKCQVLRDETSVLFTWAHLNVSILLGPDVPGKTTYDPSAEHPQRQILNR